MFWCLCSIIVLALIFTAGYLLYTHFPMVALALAAGICASVAMWASDV